MNHLEILPGLFFFQRGYLSGNHFATRGKSLVLVDSAYIGELEVTEGRLAEIGIALSDVSLIVNTHTHCDHIGANHHIQELSGCEIALHRVGRHFIEQRDDWSTWWRYYDQKAEFFTPTRSLEDGERLAIGAHEFQVIYTPGHASDGIVLYNPTEKILISADTLWERDMGVMTVRVEGSRSILVMQESLERISHLEVNVVYPGHGPPFTTFQESLARAQNRLQAFLNDPQRVGDDVLKKITVYTLLMRGPRREETFFQDLMATIWFPETVNFYFSGEHQTKYSQTIAALLQRGAIERQDGALRACVLP